MTINVARSAEEAERQARGEDVSRRRDDDDDEEVAAEAEEAFEQPATTPRRPERRSHRLRSVAGRALERTPGPLAAGRFRRCEQGRLPSRGSRG